MSIIVGHGLSLGALCLTQPLEDLAPLKVNNARFAGYGNSKFRASRRWRNGGLIAIEMDMRTVKFGGEGLS